MDKRSEGAMTVIATKGKRAQGSEVTHELDSRAQWLEDDASDRKHTLAAVDCALDADLAHALRALARLRLARALLLLLFLAAVLLVVLLPAAEPLALKTLHNVNGAAAVRHFLRRAIGIDIARPLVRRVMWG